MKEFSRFLETFTDRSIKTSKKYNKQLEKDAIKWLEENFNASFGSYNKDGTQKTSIQRT